MKSCCLDTWYETNAVIRMITWEDTRRQHGGDKYSQDELFVINYTCYRCGRKWDNIDIRTALFKDYYMVKYYFS